MPFKNEMRMVLEAVEPEYIFLLVLLAQALVAQEAKRRATSISAN